MTRRIGYAVGLSICLAMMALLALWIRGRSETEGGARQGPPPSVVAAAPATKQHWQTHLESVGTLTSILGVEVTTEVGGLVSTIDFESGQEVEKGELLVQLSTATERARLSSLTAQAEQGRADLKRRRTLAQRGLIAKAALEESTTAAKSLEAQAREQRELINKKRIEAPFAGRLGIRQIDLGEYLPPGSPIVVLETIAPIHVDFSLPEQHYAVIAPGQRIEVRVDAFANEVFQGTVSAVSPRIDESTRNFKVQGELSNESQRLRPGMFAQIAVATGVQREVTAVPASAISYSPYGDSVYVVQSPSDAGDAADEAQPPSTVTRRFVEMGERRGIQVAIEGVDPGALVVTAGQLKLFDGAPVVISDKAAESLAASGERR